MDLLISSVQGMQKDIKGILDNQNSLVRIFENRIKTLNDKVDGLTKTVNELKKEVDSVPSPDTSDDEDDSPLRPGTHFTTQARSATVPVPELRPSSSAPATTTGISFFAVCHSRRQRHAWRTAKPLPSASRRPTLRPNRCRQKADLPSAGRRQRGKPLCRLLADGKVAI